MVTINVFKQENGKYDVEIPNAKKASFTNLTKTAAMNIATNQAAKKGGGTVIDHEKGEAIDVPSSK